MLRSRVLIIYLELAILVVSGLCNRYSGGEGGGIGAEGELMKAASWMARKMNDVISIAWKR